MWNDSDDDTDVENNFESNENDFLDLFGGVLPITLNTPVATAARSTNNRFNFMFNPILHSAPCDNNYLFFIIFYYFIIMFYYF